jgi:oleate hydratase
LIKQAKVPAHQVHILGIHPGSGGALKTSGNSREGYVLHTGAQPYFHEDCVKDLLAMVPSPNNPDKTSWEEIKELELYSKPINKAHTRAIRQIEEGLRNVDMHHLPIGAKLRMDLIRFILDGGRGFDSNQIHDVFGKTFFKSEF